MLPVTFYAPISITETETQDKLLRLLADNGVKHIVLDSKMLGQLLPDVTPGLKLLDKMKSYGLDFLDSHAIWGNWADPGIPLEEPRQLASLRARCTFHICKALNVHTMAFHTGNTYNNVFGNFTIDDYWKALVRSLEELVPEAEKCDVKIALENQWTPLNHSRHLLNAVDLFKSPYLGLCLDVGHAHLMEKGPDYPDKTIVPGFWKDMQPQVDWDTDVMDRMAPYIVNCHLHDNSGILDNHLLPGQGDVDWTHVKKILFSAPRLQCIQPEISTGDTEESIRTLCNTFRDLLGFL